MVGEARAHVQGESLKARAALHVRLINSPIARGKRRLDMLKIIGIAVLLVGGWIAFMAITADPQAEKSEADYEAQHSAHEAAEQAKEDAEDARKQVAKDAANAKSDDTIPYHYDVQTSIATAVLHRMEMATRQCLNEAAILKLHQGERSRKAIVTYSAKLCGQRMAQMMQAPDLAPGTGEAYVEALAYEELDKAIQSGQ